MITSNQPKITGPGVPLPTKIMVDSHDTKPTNVKNGAKLKEIDTGKEFIYNEGTSTWDEQPSEGGEGGGGSSMLSGLTDVDISNPSNGQTLVYNSTSGKWENTPPRILRVEQVYDESTGDIILRETWQTIHDALSEGIFVYISGSGEGHEYNSQELVISAYTENNSYEIKSAGAQYQTANVYI